MASPEEQDEAEEVVQAVVNRISGTGNRRYVVTYPVEGATLLPKGTVVTFSLSEWKGRREPAPGQVVALTEVEKFSKGWRARSASPIRPAKSGKEQV